MTRIADLLAAGQTFSFEFFPPKTQEARIQLGEAIRKLEPLHPDFVSVTYGAGGSTRETTHDIVASLRHITRMTPMAHLTCVGHTRLDLAEILVRYRKAGIENLMALGGDPNPDPSLPAAELTHAIELVEMARVIGGFCIGVAAHPEVHPRSESRAGDRRFLAEKLRLADFGVTQFFFEAEHYFSMVEELAALGVEKPILPGIMPVTNLGSIARMAAMSHAHIPETLLADLEAADSSGGDVEVRKVGIAHATELCRQLLDGGAPGLHLYTMNRSAATREIYANLGLGTSRS